MQLSRRLCAVGQGLLPLAEPVCDLARLLHQVAAGGLIELLVGGALRLWLGEREDERARRASRLQGGSTNLPRRSAGRTGECRRASRAVSQRRLHTPEAGRGPPLPHAPGMSMATTVAPISISFGKGPIAEPAPIITTYTSCRLSPLSKWSESQQSASAASGSMMPPAAHSAACALSALPLRQSEGPVGGGSSGCDDRGVQCKAR